MCFIYLCILYWERTPKSTRTLSIMHRNVQARVRFVPVFPIIINYLSDYTGLYIRRGFDSCFFRQHNTLRHLHRKYELHRTYILSHFSLVIFGGLQIYLHLWHNWGRIAYYNYISVCRKNSWVRNFGWRCAISASQGST